MKNTKNLLLIALTFSIMINSIVYSYDISTEYSIKAKLTDDLIAFEVEFSKFGYVGLCFGNTMTNTDMILVQLNEDDTFSVLDTWSTRHRRPTEDTKIGGTNDIKKPKLLKKAGLSIITFERKINTEDQYDSVIELSKSNEISLAWLPENAISYHDQNLKFLFC